MIINTNSSNHSAPSSSTQYLTISSAKMESGMKKKTSSVFVIGLLVLGAMCGEAESQLSEAATAFMSCYAPCFLLCYVTPGHTTSYCSLECLKDCIIPKWAVDDVSQSHGQTQASTHQFCQLGCASVLCSNISTKKNPQVVKVGKCVGSCSDMCTNNNCSSP